MCQGMVIWHELTNPEACCSSASNRAYSSSDLREIWRPRGLPVCCLSVPRVSTRELQVCTRVTWLSLFIGILFWRDKVCLDSLSCLSFRLVFFLKKVGFAIGPKLTDPGWYKLRAKNNLPPLAAVPGRCSPTLLLKMTSFLVEYPQPLPPGGVQGIGV